MVHHLPFSVTGKYTCASDLDCCNVTTPRSTVIISASPHTYEHDFHCHITASSILPCFDFSLAEGRCSRGELGAVAQPPLLPGEDPAQWSMPFTTPLHGCGSSILAPTKPCLMLSFCKTNSKC